MSTSSPPADQPAASGAVQSPDNASRSARPVQKSSPTADLSDAHKSAFSNPTSALSLSALSAAAAGATAMSIPPPPSSSTANPRVAQAIAKPVSAPSAGAPSGPSPAAPWGWPTGAPMNSMGTFPMMPQQLGLMGYPGMPYGVPAYPPMGSFSVPTMYSDSASAASAPTAAAASQDPAAHSQMAANMGMPSFYPYAMNQMQMMAMSQLSGVSPMGTPMMPLLPTSQFVQPLQAAVASAVGKPVSLKDSARLKALVDELASPQMPACVNCRRSKVRCEGGIPCTRCKRLAWEDTCTRCVPQKRGRKRKTALSPGSPEGNTSPSKVSPATTPSPSSSFVLSSTNSAAAANGSRSRHISPLSANSSKSSADTNSFSPPITRTISLPSTITIPPAALGRGTHVKQELNISGPSSSTSASSTVSPGSKGPDASTITAEMLRQMFQAAIDAAIPLLIEPSASLTDSVSAQTLAEKVAALVLLEKYPAEHVLPRAIKHMDTLHQTGALESLIPVTESPSKRIKRTPSSELSHRLSSILPHITQLILTSPFWPPATTETEAAIFRGFKLRPDAVQIQIPTSALLPAVAPTATTIGSVLLGPSASANSPTIPAVEAPTNLEQKFKEIASIEEELKKRREELESLYRERHAALLATIGVPTNRGHVTQSPAIVAQSPSGNSVASESAASDITASTSNETAAISVLAAAACSSLSSAPSASASSL